MAPDAEGGGEQVKQLVILTAQDGQGLVMGEHVPVEHAVCQPRPITGCFARR
jgi:hypothetical protein